MAKENGISREEQDQIAFISPPNARPPPSTTAASPARCARCWCRRATSRGHQPTTCCARDTTLEALAALPPVFDRKYGTVTAGNASPLTDGAAAVLLMSEEKAQRRRATSRWPSSAPGRWPPWIPAASSSWARPRDPDGARPRGHQALADIDLIEMHEAFAAQVASNIQALESETWAREKLGRSKAVGKVDRERLNVCGGSIALGHPFGATGARITTTLANELKRDGADASASSRSARQGGMGLRDGARAVTREGGGARRDPRPRPDAATSPAPTATMLLGDLGADVVKVEEPPVGDRTRVVPPAVGEDSAAHAALNRNKRSVVVDLRQRGGRCRRAAAGRAGGRAGRRPSARASWRGAASAPRSCGGAPAPRLLLADRLRPGWADGRARRPRHRLHRSRRLARHHPDAEGAARRSRPRRSPT